MSAPPDLNSLAHNSPSEKKFAPNPIKHCQLHRFCEYQSCMPSKPWYSFGEDEDSVYETTPIIYEKASEQPTYFYHSQNPKNKNPLPEGKKLVITEYEIDKWVLTNMGHNIDDIPNSRPHNMSMDVFAKYRKYAKKQSLSAKELKLKEQEKHSGPFD